VRTSRMRSFVSCLRQVIQGSPIKLVEGRGQDAWRKVLTYIAISTKSN